MLSSQELIQREDSVELQKEDLVDLQKKKCPDATIINESCKACQFYLKHVKLT